MRPDRPHAWLSAKAALAYFVEGQFDRTISSLQPLFASIPICESD